MNIWANFEVSREFCCMDPVNDLRHHWKWDIQLGRGRWFNDLSRSDFSVLQVTALMGQESHLLPVLSGSRWSTDCDQDVWDDGLESWVEVHEQEPGIRPWFWFGLGCMLWCCPILIASLANPVSPVSKLKGSTKGPVMCLRHKGNRPVVT